MAIFNPNAWSLNFVICVFVYMTLVYYFIKNEFKDKFTISFTFLSFALMSWASESLVGDFFQSLCEELCSITIGALILALTLLRLKFKN